MKTIWRLKDTLKVRLDIKKTNIRPKLHPIEDGANGRTLLLIAPYILSKLEKTMFIKIIRMLKTSTNYVAQLSKRITMDGEL